MLKVFLVDDEYYERLSLKNNIPWAEHGMTVCGEANNGKTALQMMSADPPQIAVVDINMPGLSGLELIEQLNAQRIPCRYLILTGYDEFKYAQQAIHLGVFDYILKPINYQTLVQALDGLRKEIEQRDTLNNHLENLKNENERFYLERYYNDLVNCNFTIHNMKEYDQKLADDLLVSYGSYQIIVAEIPEKPSLEELRRFQGKLEEGLNKEDSFSCLDIKNRLFFIFDGGKETVYPRIIQTLLSLAKEKGYTVQVGAGNAYPGFEQMYLSYNEACIALENCAMLKQQIVFYRDIGTSWKYRGLDAKEKNGIKTLVFSRSMGELKQKLTDIYQVMGEGRANRDQVILRTLELLNLLTEILSSQALSPISVIDMEESVLDTLSGMRKIEQVRDWIIDRYLNSISQISKEQEDYSNITICVENYILEHFGDPELTIAAISKALFLNYSYICYCFKRDKQMTINDFMNKIRIEKAIGMFQDGIDNVSYVAEKAGYGSASYFSKQFKRATGLPPSDYIRTLGPVSAVRDRA